MGLCALQSSTPSSKSFRDPSKKRGFAGERGTLEKVGGRGFVESVSERVWPIITRGGGFKISSNPRGGGCQVWGVAIVL